MEDEITIYHGSISIIEKPIYGKGKIHNDYGLGFYTTKSFDLACEWAVSEDNDGYANKYLLNTSGLNILNLTENNFSTLHWITLLIQNRVFSLKNNISLDGKKYLINNYSLPSNDYDIIIGYRADDCYFSYAESFLNNTITLRQLSYALKLGKLGKQIVLKSKKAFDNIKFIESYRAESKIYYLLRKKRNEDARNDFYKALNSNINSDDLFLSDIIRKKVIVND